MMINHFRHLLQSKHDRGGLLIAGLHILIGGLWILFSDQLAALLTRSKDAYLAVSLYKGWGYVLVTGVLLYSLIQVNNRALRKANREYLLLAENITDVIWVLDLETLRFTYVSPSIQKLRGLTSEEALGETLQEAVSPASLDYLNRLLPARLEAFEEGRARSYTDELEQFHKDGSALWVEVTSRFVRNPETGRIEVYGITRDITERWQVQEILRKNEARFHSAFDNMLEGAQIIGRDWCYLYLNPVAEIHNRRPNAELIGKIYMEMWPGIAETQVFQVIQRCMKERVPAQMENRLIYPDGAAGWFALSIQPIPEGVFILSVDITERVRAEEQVRQMKRLYATLSQVNQTIVRVKEPDDLYRSICDVAVQYGEFALAWVGLLDETSGEVWPVAAHGADFQQWPFPRVNIHQGPFAQGLVAAAIRTGRVVTSEDIQTDERVHSLQGQSQEHGYHSSAAVPFQVQGKTIGALSLVSRETGFFKSEDELRLLDEMGLDISFALNAMETERVRRQWADAFENCALGMALENPASNRIQTCNPAFARSLGRTVEEISGMSILEIYLPEDRDRIREQVADSDRAGRTQFETRMIRKDGSTFLAQMDVVSVRNEGGKLLYRVATQQDITKRSQVEQELRESREQLAGILDSTMDAIISLDDTQRIILFNTAAEQMFGCPAAEAIGQPLDRFIPERFRETHRQQIQAYGETKQTRRLMDDLGPLTCLRANGEEFPAEITISQLQIGGQNIYTAILRDVTSRLRAEAALQKSEARYRALFDDSPIAIWEEDFSRIKQYLDALKEQGVTDFHAHFAAHPGAVLETGSMIRVLDVNKAALTMFRAANRDELVRITEGEMSQGELDHHLEDLIAIAEGRTSNSWTGRDMTLDGEPLEIELSWSVMPGYEHDYSQVVVTTVDVTERKRAEAELRLSEMRYRMVVENQTEFIVRWKPDGIRTFANEAYRRYFGINTEDAVHTSFMPLIVEEDRKAAEEKIKRLLSGAVESETDVHRVTRPDGSIAWQEWVDRAIQDETGRVVELLSVGRDVTERVLAEQQIQLQLRRMRALNEIDRAISSSLDMRVSLDILLGEVIAQLGVDAASILLLNTFGQRLEFVAGKGFHTPAINRSQMRLGDGLAGQVGLERKVIHIQDLPALGSEFKRAELLKDERFVEYFGVPLIAKGFLKGVLEIFNRTALETDPEWVYYLETLGGQAAIAIDNVQMFEGMQQLNLDLVSAYDATIAGWSRAMDLRDKETEGHTQRVTELTLKLAERMGISRHEMIHVRRGALLHDIGKLGIPDQILLKPGKLTDEEWVIMRQHPNYAFEMLNSIHYLRPAIDIPYCHHEKWDGSGYPRGLKSDLIPLPARVFAVVDVWDALRSDRPYRAGWSTEQTLAYIREQAGKHFDPEVVEAFLEIISEP
jgi:PAS domain S-box-containing protein/putative nucleotidyltransferase with HDIG domain